MLLVMRGDNVVSARRSMKHIPEIAYCPVRVRLADEFLHAIRNLTRLHTQQSQAIIDGDTEFSRFDLLIHVALEAKEEAKYALISHIQSHNCEEGVDIVALTHVEKERVNDSRLKLQSVSKSLKQVNPKEIPGIQALEDCLDDAEKNLRKALDQKSEEK